MATPLTIHLRDDLRRYVEDEVASGRYANEDQVIEAALESLSESPDLVIEPTMTIQEAVAEARSQIERGESEPYTETFREASRVRALDRARADSAGPAGNARR